MARIRTVKPEFWDSPGTARASLRARLFFIAMWNYADDWGIGDGHPLRLLSFAFPNDETSDVEPRNFRLLASEVAECFDVQWYEVDGRAFYMIPSWEAHQRTEKKAKRKNPTPDQAVSFLYGSASENPPLNRGLASDGKGKGEVGKGKWEQGTGDISKTSKSQSSSNRARVSTDSLSPVSKRLAGQYALRDIPALRDEIEARTSCVLTLDRTVHVCRTWIDKSPQQVQDADAYMRTVLTNSAAEVQRYIYDRGLAS